jgi:hypothetical protein
VYIKNSYKNINLPPSLQEINDLIMNENVGNNLDYFKDVFNKCMALIIKNLVDPATPDDVKQQIISMFANAISYAKNNIASKRQIFGIQDDDQNDIENVVENIKTTDPTKIDNVLEHFFNTRKQDVFKRKPFESISSEFKESSGTPETRKGVKDGKSASVGVMQRQSGNNPKSNWLPGIGSGTDEVLTTLNQQNTTLPTAQPNTTLPTAQPNTTLPTNTGTPLVGDNLHSPLIGQNLAAETTPPPNTIPTSNITVGGPFLNSTEAGSQDNFYRNFDTSSSNPSQTIDTFVDESQNMDKGGKRLKKTRRQRKNKNKKTKRSR